MATPTRAVATGATVAPRTSSHRLLDRVWLVSLQILLTILLISFLIPTIWMVSSSLKAPTEIFVHPTVWIPRDPQWTNYVRAFTVQPFGLFAVNTLIVTFFAVLGTVISSLLVAYSFARLRWPGREIWFALLLATMMLPEVIMLIPRFLIFRNLGWLDTFLPLTVPYWLAATPLYVFLVRQFFQGIPYELEEAALIDGASRWQILWRILIPLSKPVIATVTIFAILQHYNEFMTPLIYINSREKWTMALGIAAYNDAYAAQWELIFAAGTIMLVPILILFLVAQRYFVQGIALTGFGGR